MAIAWPPPLRRQVQVLVDQFLLDPPALIGVSGLDSLAGPKALRRARIEMLGNHVLQDAFVWTEKADPQLWVDPGASNYRDLFDEFARERLGLAGRPVNAGFDIDHVFPKTAGLLNGLTHVRLMAIAAPGNRAAGRTMEKVMAQRARDMAGRKRIRSATWVSIGKAVGFPDWEALPDGPAGEQKNRRLVDALFDYLAACGITPPAGNLERGLTTHTIGRIR